MDTIQVTVIEGVERTLLQLPVGATLADVARGRVATLNGNPVTGDYREAKLSDGDQVVLTKATEVAG